MKVYYKAVKTDMGYVLAARSEKGLCALYMGDKKGELVKELKKVRKGDELVEDKKGQHVELDPLLEIIEKPSERILLPLHMRGTPFQQKVWRALTSIPAGETISYSDLARRVGQPSAVRAVSTACGKNELSVLIPCHRVVGKDGSLTGYRWGLKRKKKLLEREGAKAA